MKQNKQIFHNHDKYTCRNTTITRYIIHLSKEVCVKSINCFHLSCTFQKTYCTWLPIFQQKTRKQHNSQAKHLFLNKIKIAFQVRTFMHLHLDMAYVYWKIKVAVNKHIQWSNTLINNISTNITIYFSWK